MCVKYVNAKNKMNALDKCRRSGCVHRQGIRCFWSGHEIDDDQRKKCKENGYLTSEPANPLEKIGSTVPLLDLIREVVKF